MFSNSTSFAGEAAPFVDERGADAVVVMLKATFVKKAGKLSLAERQLPVRLADVPTDPTAVAEDRPTSIRYFGELCGEKPGADVVVVGSAVARKPVAAVDVAVRAPGRVVALRVHGERVFYKSPFGWKIGPAAPFERAAVSYERAYGGTSKDGSLVDWRNPVGRGVHKAQTELEGALAPSIEDPAHPIQSAEESIPVGFGAIPTWWLPRRRLAGTMDQSWVESRMPLMPQDFDRRFWHVAHPLLQLERNLLPGDVLATNEMSEDGLFECTIPELRFAVHAHRSKGAVTSSPLVLDTALLEPEAARLELTWRRVLPLGRGPSLLKEVRVDVDA